MTETAWYSVSYSIGTIFGLFILFGFWALKQPISWTTREVLHAHRAELILSTAVAASGCLVWAEGTVANVWLAKYSIGLTHGTSIASGVTVESCGLIMFRILRSKLAKWGGVKEEK